MVLTLASRSWLDVIGHPRSESMRLTEPLFPARFRALTFDDPKLYTRPFIPEAPDSAAPYTPSAGEVPFSHRWY